MAKSDLYFLVPDYQRFDLSHGGQLASGKNVEYAFDIAGGVQFTRRHDARRILLRGLRQLHQDRGESVKRAPAYAHVVWRQLGQTQVEDSDLSPADYRRARRDEFAAAVTHMPRVLGQQGFNSRDVAAEKTIEETLHRAPRLFLQRTRRRQALPVIIAHRPPRAVMRCLDVRFAHAERVCGLLDRIIEDVAQQQHRALRRLQRFQREQEGEGHAFEHVVARRRISFLVHGLVGRRSEFVAGLDRRRQPWAFVTSPLAPAQQVSAQIHRHAYEPWPPRLVSPRGRPLPRAHERLLRQVVGVRRVAGHPVTQTPNESFVSAEYLFKGRSGETLRGRGTHYC